MDLSIPSLHLKEGKSTHDALKGTKSDRKNVHFLRKSNPSISVHKADLRSSFKYADHVENCYMDLKGASENSNADMSKFSHKLFPRRYKVGNAQCKVHRYGTTRTAKAKTVSSQSVDIQLPRIKLDSFSTDTKLRRSPFIENHRTYLKQKGYNLDVLYLLNGKRKSYERELKKYNEAQEVLDNSTEAEQQKGFLSPRGPQDKCHYLDMEAKSIRNPLIIHMMRGLEKESEIPGHVKSSDIKSSHLGKVLSPRQLQILLSYEQPVIPFTFYNNRSFDAKDQYG